MIQFWLFTLLINVIFCQTTSSVLNKELCKINCIGNKFCSQVCEVNNDDGIFKEVKKCTAGNSILNRLNCTLPLVKLNQDQFDFYMDIVGKQFDCQKEFDGNTVNCANNCTAKSESVNDSIDCTKKCGDKSKPALVKCFTDLGMLNSTTDYTKAQTCESKCDDATEKDWSGLYTCSLDCFEPIYKAYDLNVAKARGELAKPSDKDNKSTQGSKGTQNNFNLMLLITSLLFTLFYSI